MKLLFIFSIVNCIMVIYLYAKLSGLRDNYNKVLVRVNELTDNVIKAKGFLKKFREDLIETDKLLIDVKEYADEISSVLEELFKDHEVSIKYLDKLTDDLDLRTLILEKKLNGEPIE